MGMPTDCERFEEIIERDDPPEEAEIDFLLEHQATCPIGIHTLEGLEKFHGLPPGSLRNWDPTKPFPVSPPRHYEELIRKFLEMPLDEDDEED